MARFGHAASAVALLVALSTSNGGRAQSVQTGYVYDVHGRLVKVTRPSSTTDYTYDNAQNRTHLTTTQGNNLPTSATYTISIPASGAYAVNPLGHHSDADGDTLTVASVTASGAPRGTLANTTTQITYTPNANQGGQSDSFTYTVSDGKGGIGTGAVTVNIQAVQPAPAAQPFSVAITPNSAGNVVNYSLPLSFTGSTPTSVTASTPSAGSTSISGTSILYSSSGWSGQTSLQYTGTNGAGTGSPATATISVRPVVADATGLTATAGQAQTVSLSPYAKTTNISSMYLPNGPNTQKGTASISGTTLTYTPNPNTTGADTFAYQATSPGGTSAAANITFSISPQPNRNPVAGTDFVSVDYNTQKTFAVLGNDSDPDNDPLTITSTSTNSGAYSAVNGDKTITYSPISGFSGSDILYYNLSDGRGGTAQGVVSITVQPKPNSPPVAVDEVVNADQNSVVTLTPLANDSDPDAGDQLQITAIGPLQFVYGTEGSSAPLGSIVNNGTSVTFNTPMVYPGAYGHYTVVRFQYWITDGHGHTATALHAINVNSKPGPNSPPVANYDVVYVSAGEIAYVDVVGNDTDPDNNALTLTGISTTSTPKANYAIVGNQIQVGANSNTGSNTITYTISDGAGGTATGTLAVYFQD